MQPRKKSPRNDTAIARRIYTRLAEQGRRHALFNSTIGEVLYQPVPVGNSLIGETILFAGESRGSGDGPRRLFASSGYGASAERIFYAKLAVFEGLDSPHRRREADAKIATPSKLT